MIREGYESIQRNWIALLQYLAIVLPFHIANLAAGQFIVSRQSASDPLTLSLFEFGADIAVAAGYALAQSIVFARIGADLDRPFWKHAGVTDALRRFFLLWFLLDLASISLGKVIVPLGEEVGGGSEVIALLTWVVLSGAVVPFGACVMFYGKTARHEMGEALNTIVMQLPRLLPVLLLAWGVSFFLFAIISEGALPIWQYPLLTVIASYVDCIVFASTWLICRIHRDEEPGDQDFDF